uniref:Uncharacterized protein n=1 Tax=Hyaloperonospora arabidopsidis (strain Emoy2) TaxID=559515 RepID=M4B5J5_HYAAE
MAAATDDVVVLAAAAVAVETEGEAQVSVDVSVAVPSWCLMVVVQSFLACDRHDGARGKCKSTTNMTDANVEMEAAIESQHQPRRYSFVEIKEAQRVCSDKMMAASLQEVGGSASAAQQQIFRAHVNDLCATVFAAALRKYNPENKEEMAPLDTELATKLKELEAKVTEKEADVKKLREEVPVMAAENARRELAKARKRYADVLVTEPETTIIACAELTNEQTEALEAVYVKEKNSLQNPNSLRTRLTLQLSAPGNV